MEEPRVATRSRAADCMAEGRKNSRPFGREGETETEIGFWLFWCLERFGLGLDGRGVLEQRIV
jgi:hypothetical protein